MDQDRSTDQPSDLEYLMSSPTRGTITEPFQVPVDADSGTAGPNDQASLVQQQNAGHSMEASSHGGGASSGVGGEGGPAQIDKNSRVMRNRAMARVSNAKRKGRIKEMESGLEKTRQRVQELQESIRSLEAENNDLRSMLQQ